MDEGWNILRALWLFLPAYVANMSPVFSSKLVPKWRTPIDFGADHADGRRVLGDGKTWRGLLFGALAGGLTALGMAHFPLPIPVVKDTVFALGDGSASWGIFVFGFMMGFLALTGDAVESYFKRRRGKERGAPWIPFDQLDFVVFGLASAFIFAPLLAEGWALELYGSAWTLVTLLVGTVALHLIVNRIGYWIGLKDVPW